MIFFGLDQTGLVQALGVKANRILGSYSPICRKAARSASGEHIRSEE
jgi:hypothetical protein